jgi:hypothetical protein
VQNAFAESFIGRLRDELLNETLFRSLVHVRSMLEVWRADYNHDRPHSRLGWLSPATYAAQRWSAALRSTDGSAPRTAATPAHEHKATARLQSSLDKSSGQRHPVSSTAVFRDEKGVLVNINPRNRRPLFDECDRR